MPFDVVDQETVNKLPRLSELHKAYGVRVNEIDVDDLFGLYERTGFLYPDKAARLLPHLDLVKENWGRMFRAGESLLYVLTAGDEKRGQAALAVWRSSHQGWTFQHLVSENNPYASRAVMLAAEAASILKGSDESAQNWFRPENRFPARVFGSMVDTIGGSFSSVQTHAYCALSRNQAMPAHGGIQIIPYDSPYRADLCALAANTRGDIYVSAEELTGDAAFKALDALYRRVGLRRTRHIWLAFENGRVVGATIVYRGPVGLNFSFLENRCDLLLVPDLSDNSMRNTAAGLLSAALTAYENFELDHIPVIASEQTVPALQQLGAQSLRHYSQCIWLKGGYPRGYRHVESFYSKVLLRAEKRSFAPSFSLESSR